MKTRIAIGIVLALAGPVALAVAAEAAEFGEERALLVPGTLHGWDEAEQLTGWRATERGLCAARGATALRSAFAFDEHELAAGLQLEPGGALLFRWLRADGAEALALRVRADELAWIAGGQVLAAQTCAAPAGAELRIVHRGSTWSADLGTARCAIESAEFRGRFQLGLAAEGAGGGLERLRVREPRGEELEGAALARWSCDGERAAWTVVDEELRLAPGNGRYLRSDELLANFALSFRYRLPRGANSGVALRTPPGGWPSTDGIELQLLHARVGAPLDEHMCGALYGNLAPLARALRLDDWNDVAVVLDGTHLCAWWNGVLVQCDDLALHPELRDRPARGWIGFQDHGAALSVRELHLRKLPEETALASSQRPLSCAQRALLGAVEPGLLARSLEATERDAEPIATRIESAGSAPDALLAELPGPGVLLRIDGLAPRERLRLRRDGESAACFEGTVAELARHADAWGKADDELRLALPFSQSLRLEAAGRPAPIRAVIVHLPARDASPRELARARGFLEVARYRRTQHGNGRIRSFPPLRNEAAHVRNLQPGSALRLDFEGSGEVVWLGVEPAERASSSELWLRATSDGRATPELELPLRHLFAARASGRLAQSLHELDGERAALRYALPFAKGIALELVNRGARSEPSLALRAVVRPLAGPGEVPRARLVGRFRAGGAEAALALAGRGCALRFTAAADGIASAIEAFEFRRDGAPIDLLELLQAGRSSREPLWCEAAFPPRFERAWSAHGPPDTEASLLAYLLLEGDR